MTSMLAWRHLLLALALTAWPVASGGAHASEAVDFAQAQQQSQPSPAPSPTPAASASPEQTNAVEPIGNVATVTGIATVIRDKNSYPLRVRDDIYLNDIVQTSSNSSLGITFTDATTFNLTAGARITIDNYLFEDGGKQNSAIVDVGKGTVAFVAAAVARTGNMKITTPTATLGIRGTTGVVDVPESASAGSTSNVNIKLYPDPDGRVGHIDVDDRSSGARLGALTQGASGFAIRPGAAGAAGARLTAVPITIPPQQIARDRNVVSQVHLAQATGRQIVSEQREFRRANPAASSRIPRPSQPPQQQQLRPNPPPGQQPPRPNVQPGQNSRPGQQQPSAPGRQGSQPSRPQQGQGGAVQPGAPRGGQGAQPGSGPQRQPQRGGGLQPGGAVPTQPAATPQPRTAPQPPRTDLQRPTAQPPRIQRQVAPAPRAPVPRQQAAPRKPAPGTKDKERR